MQLPFAAAPLVKFVSDKALMGHFVTERLPTVLAWLVTLLIISLNATLLIDTFTRGKVLCTGPRLVVSSVLATHRSGPRSQFPWFMRPVQRSV